MKSKILYMLLCMLMFLSAEACGKRIDSSENISSDNISSDNMGYWNKFQEVVSEERDIENGQSLETMEKPYTQFMIVKDVDDVERYTGDRVELLVDAKGVGSFDWLLSRDSGETWEQCQYEGALSDCICFSVLEYMYGYLFKCVMVDEIGDYHESQISKLSAPPVKIIEEPADCRAYVGETVAFSCEGIGQGLVYQWYLSDDNGESWRKCKFGGSDSKYVYKTNVTKKSDGSLLFCEITDKMNNTVNTNIVKLTVEDKVLEGNDTIYTFVNADTTYKGEGKVAIGREEQEIRLKKWVINETPCVTYAVNSNIGKGKQMILHFSIRGEAGDGKIVLTVGEQGGKGVFPVMKTSSDYYIPLEETDYIGELKIEFLLSETTTAQIGNFEVIIDEYGHEQGGIFYTDDYTITCIDSEFGFGENVDDLIYDGVYVYAIGDGVLYIYRITENTYELISYISGLGTTRKAEWISDGNILAISSRENGVWIVDVSDKNKPIKCSNIPSLNLATGIKTFGDYLFVCSRFHGLEIWNVSDVYSPYYVSRVWKEKAEMYDCAVEGNTLVVSCWSGSRVLLSDISNISSPTVVSEILLSGQGGGCLIEKGMLYVATGYNSCIEGNENTTELGKGYGNGFEIWDISDKEKPILLSISRIDGRYFNADYDHWKVYLSGQYIYYINSYIGCFKYDASDLSAPVRTDHIMVNNSDMLRNGAKKSLGNYIFPLGKTTEEYAVVKSLLLLDEKVILGTSKGMIAYEDLTSSYVSDARIYNYHEDGNLCGETLVYENEKVTVTQKELGLSIYGVATDERFMYCASGEKGVVVLEKDTFSIVTSLKTNGVAKDLDMKNGYLYVAESEAGIGIYGVTVGGDLYEVGRYLDGKNNVAYSALEVTTDGCYIIAQSGWRSFVVIDSSNMKKTVLISEQATGSMYSRSICISEKEGLYGATSSGKLIWYDLAQNNAYEYKFNGYSETDGMTQYKNGVIAIAKGGYLYYSPRMIDQKAVDEMQPIKVAGVWMAGTPNIHMENIMTVADSKNGNVLFVDISILDKPIVIASLHVGETPIKSVSDGENVYVPLGHGGLAVCKIRQ